MHIQNQKFFDFRAKKRKRMMLAHTLPYWYVFGAVFAVYLPCKAFAEAGQGEDTFFPVSCFCTVSGTKNPFCRGKYYLAEGIGLNLCSGSVIRLFFF